jgi:hypothetical protein
MSKISTVALKKSKISSLSEKYFKNSIATNIKGLKKITTFNEKEEKEKNDVIKEFSNCIKGNMFTISKSGKKFREIKLKQRLSNVQVKK